MLFLFSIYLVVISSHFPDYFHTHMTLFTFYCQFLHCMKKRCHTITSWHFVFPTFVFRFLSFEAALGQTSCVHYFLLWIYHCQGTKCTFYILTSFVVIPNFLLELFFKPVLSLFQGFAQSETNTVNISLLLAFFKSSFDSFSSRKLDRSLLSFSFHLVSLLVHSFKNALSWFLQKLFRRSGFPLAERSLKFLLQLFLFLFYVIFQSEIFTGWKMLLLLCLLPFSW